MTNLNTAIFLVTNELEHLEEWYSHHKARRFENFFIYVDSKAAHYLNNISENLKSCINELKVIDINHYSQLLTLYTKFCFDHPEFDYILFIDSDEYYESKTNNVNIDIKLLQKKLGSFDCLCLHQRLYGSDPAFETRVPIDSYRQWKPGYNVKSFVNPKAVMKFNGPHFPKLKKGNCIDESGKIILPVPYDPSSYQHFSKHVWTKHIFTRSRQEWIKKASRNPNKENSFDIHLKDNKIPNRYALNHFDKYNRHFPNIDV
jgi:hypothetical protein